MAAHHRSVAVDDVARGKRAPASLLDKAGVVAVRHKADVLAVGLLRVDEPLFRGDAAHVALFVKAAEGQQRVCQALLRKGVEDVALIFLGIGSASEFPGTAPGGHNLRVVPGGHVVAALLQGKVEQRAELEIAVAIDARVGCGACQVGVHKAIHHGALERLPKIEHMVGDAQALGHALRIGDVRKRAAGARAVCPKAARAGEAHGGADALVALLFEQVGGDARVHAAAHGDEHALFGRLAHGFLRGTIIGKTGNKKARPVGAAPRLYFMGRASRLRGCAPARAYSANRAVER